MLSYQYDLRAGKSNGIGVAKCSGKQVCTYSLVLRIDSEDHAQMQVGLLAVKVAW
tara:strand:- start:760 stop:924 length:165 start_codon:yes stop_codon:yes gene_type:complete